MTSNQKVGTLEFGLGGHHEEIYPRKEGNLNYGQSTLSGYSSTQNWKADNKYDYSDCIVIDKCSILRKDPRLAIISPLLELGLKDGERDELSSESISGSLMADYMMNDPGNQFGTLLKVQKAQKRLFKSEPGSLDKISRSEYVSWWKSRGARVGRIDENNLIVWEN
jgi:hypothetical protein